MKKRIVLTGGGSAGHVVVNLALLPALEEAGWEVFYIGSQHGMEKNLLSDYPQVRYEPIPTGKFRRDLSFRSMTQNCRDVGHVLSGVREAKKILKRLSPDIVFSKGGFVSVPVVLAAHRLGIPVISHESDMTPGLANKMTAPLVKKILLTFEKTMEYVPKDKAYYLGPVIRSELKGGSAQKGLERFGFSGEKPILLVLGGSLGAEHVNHLIWDNLDALLQDYDILHGVGAGKGDSTKERQGYRQVDYIKAGMNDAIAMSHLIVSRAGSNAIFEFLYYHKPMILIPYQKGSRGDQIINAAEFERAGYARALEESSLTSEGFRKAIQEVEKDRVKMVDQQKHFAFQDAVATIVELLEQYRLIR